MMKFKSVKQIAESAGWEVTSCGVSWKYGTSVTCMHGDRKCVIHGTLNGGIEYFIVNFDPIWIPESCRFQYISLKGYKNKYQSKFPDKGWTTPEEVYQFLMKNKNL